MIQVRLCFCLLRIERHLSPFVNLFHVYRRFSICFPVYKFMLWKLKFEKLFTTLFSSSECFCLEIKILEYLESEYWHLSTVICKIIRLILLHNKWLDLRWWVEIKTIAVREMFIRHSKTNSFTSTYKFHLWQNIFIALKPQCSQWQNLTKVSRKNVLSMKRSRFKAKKIFWHTWNLNVEVKLYSCFLNGLQTFSSLQLLLILKNKSYVSYNSF